MENFDIEATKETHSLFVFGQPKTSTPIDSNGKELDHGFNSEFGRVHYKLEEDGNYSIKIVDGFNSIEKTLTLEQLTAFFYDPSSNKLNELIEESK